MKKSSDHHHQKDLLNIQCPSSILICICDDRKFLGAVHLSLQIQTFSHVNLVLNYDSLGVTKNQVRFLTDLVILPLECSWRKENKTQYCNCLDNILLKRTLIKGRDAEQNVLILYGIYFLFYPCFENFPLFTVSQSLWRWQLIIKLFPPQMMNYRYTFHISSHLSYLSQCPRYDIRGCI